MAKSSGDKVWFSAESHRGHDALLRISSFNRTAKLRANGTKSTTVVTLLISAEIRNFGDVHSLAGKGWWIDAEFHGGLAGVLRIDPF